MIGTFGSFVVDAEDGGLTVGQDIVDLIYEQECKRNPGLHLIRETFGLINFHIVAPKGTRFTLNNSEYCTVVITDSKMLSIGLDTFVVRNCTLLEDCASVNCRYLY